jgi:hypothetical protein
MAKVSMRQNHGIEWRVLPNVQLITKRSSRFDEVPATCLIGNAETYWMPDVLWSKAGAA